MFKKEKKTKPVQIVNTEVKKPPQENYDVTLEVMDSATGKKSCMTERFHDWNKVRNLKDSFDLMCYRIRGFGNTAKLIIEEV